MSKPQTLQEIHQETGAQYPHPIACLLRRYRCTKPNDMGSRHKLLVDMFELLIKYLTIIVLQEGLQRDSQFLAKLPQKEKTLEFLKRPSLGGWVGLLRVLSKVDFSSTDARMWTHAIADWFLANKDENCSEALTNMERLGHINVNRESKTPCAEIIDGMVTYRNKSIAHGAQQAPGALKNRVEYLESVNAYLLQSARFMSDMKLVYTESISVADNGKWMTELIALRGATEEPECLLLNEKLELHELYLFGAGTCGRVIPVRLSPFVIWQLNDETKQCETYFYNDAWRSKLEFLSYSSGTFYYHKELSEQLKSLLRLDLVSVEHDGAVVDMSPEQRQGSAEHHAVLGHHLASQDKLEDAICQFEHSLTYERRAETFLYIARLQVRLGDPAEAIRHTLQNCLELDLDNKAATAMFSSLDDLSTEHSVDGTPSTSNLPLRMTCPITSEVLTPHKFRPFSWLVWAGSMVLYYSASMLLEARWGSSSFIPSLCLLLVCVILLLVGPPMARSLVCWIYYPLSLQLDGMRLERFEKWYRAQLCLMFGNYQFRDGVLDVSDTIRQELLYWIIWILGTTVLVVALIFSTDATGQSLPILIKRILDYTFPAFWAYPSARYVVCVTAFIYNYSQLSLKPMLTRINDEGLRALGHLTTLNASLVNAGFGSYLALSWVSIRSEWFLDVGIVLVLFVVVTTWSIGTPMMVRRACRRAKYMASLKYSTHIETAFNHFLDHPSEDTRKEYQWLVDNQRVIQRIKIWPLSVIETLTFVVGSNVFLAGFTGLYLIHRFGLWKNVRWFQ